MNVNRVFFLAPMYGDEVNIGQAFFISIFAMLIVFLVLFAISYLIDITAYLLKKETNVKITNNNIDKNVKKQNQNETALVAIIAAAIASYTGTSVENIKVKKIRRVGNFDSTWFQNGTLKQLN